MRHGGGWAYHHAPGAISVREPHHCTTMNAVVGRLGIVLCYIVCSCPPGQFGLKNPPRETARSKKLAPTWPRFGPPLGAHAQCRSSMFPGLVRCWIGAHCSTSRPPGQGSRTNDLHEPVLALPISSHAQTPCIKRLSKSQRARLVELPGQQQLSCMENLRPDLGRECVNLLL